MRQVGTEKTRMIDSITILTTALFIAFGLSVVSATLQTIGYDININPEKGNMLNKLSLGLNTMAIIIFTIGYLSVFIGW